MRTVAATRNDPAFLPEYDFELGWYVYYLWRGTEIVYIGKTKDLHQRARDHRSAKSYDRMTYASLDDESSMRRRELEDISKYHPVLNRRGVVPQVVRP